MVSSNGGGAFLVPYLVALLLVGLPVLLLECALGRVYKAGAVGAMRAISPRLVGVGVSAVSTAFFVVVYYNTLMAWTLLYLFASFNSELPWAVNGTSASDYLAHSVLDRSQTVSTGGAINIRIYGCLLLVWLCIFGSLWKGVKSAGKVLKIAMPLPLILLTVLLVRGASLPGAGAGVSYFFTPDWDRLGSPEIWLQACSQIFFSLSLAEGIMIAYASYSTKGSVVTDALVVISGNCMYSILAGITVFVFLGHTAHEAGVEVCAVAEGGPGLAFNVFPTALALLPGAPAFSFFFFAMLLCLGLSSAMSMVEAGNSVLCDFRAAQPAVAARIPPWGPAAALCSFGALVGLLFSSRAGFFWLDLFDHYVPGASYSRERAPIALNQPQRLPCYYWD